MENSGSGQSAAPVSDSQFTDTGSDESSIDSSESSDEGSESSADLSSAADVDQALENGEISKKEAKDLKRKFNLKIDGQSEDMELDLGNEDEVKKHLQKSRTFDKRSKEYASFKSQVDNFIGQIKNPETRDAILEQLGIDVDDYAEKRLTKKLEQMSKSPEQVEREKMQSELEALRKEKDEANKTRETLEQEAILKKTVAEIEQGIMKALDSTKSRLPKNNPEVLGEIAKAMKEAMNRGYNEVTVEDVVPLVEKRYMQKVKALFDILPEDMIEAYMGQNNAERLRQKRLAKMAPPTARQVTNDTGESNKGQKGATEKSTAAKVSYSDFFKR